MKPNKQAIQEWVEALESGDYQQTTGCLHDHSGFCCLGVATDLYAKKHGLEWIPTNYGFTMEGEPGVLPDSVRDWLGMELKNPQIGIDDLSELNDEDNLPFSKLAALIRKEWLEE